MKIGVVGAKGFIDHCLDFYGEGKKHDIQTNRRAIEDTLVKDNHVIYDVKVYV